MYFNAFNYAKNLDEKCEEFVEDKNKACTTEIELIHHIHARFGNKACHLTCSADLIYPGK